MTNPRYPVGCVDGSEVRREASDSSYAYNVNLNNGNVNWNNRNNKGLALACRRVSPREYQGVTLRSLYDAYKSARKGKVPSHNQTRFELHWMDALIELQRQLNAGIWNPSPTTCFIARAIMHAQQVAAFFSQLPAGLQEKTPDSLLLICREYIRKDVRIYALNMEAKRVRAYYEATDNGYNVYILEKQDPIYRNFAACKELFHVVLDDPESEDCRTINLAGHLQEVATTFPLPDGRPGKAATSEFLAELAAMEFFFPYADRLGHFNPKEPVDCEPIAKSLSLPVALVERYLSPGYMTPLFTFYSQTE